MNARTIERSAARLRELRHEERETLGVAALALVLAVVAAHAGSSLALPLFLGGLAGATLGVRALWRHWDLLDRLLGERDAQLIPEVRNRTRREATPRRRRALAESVRHALRVSGRADAVSDELRALARELEDDTLDLAPIAAVDCLRLLTDPETSPLLNESLPPEALTWRIARIREGFSPCER